MTFTIRQSRDEDANSLINLWCRAVDATHSFLTVADRQEIEVQVRHFLPDAPLWVAVAAFALSRVKTGAFRQGRLVDMSVGGV